MTAGSTQADVLSRVRREQRLRGKTSDYSGLRVVITATAITLGILLFAFGALGMLMLVRSPQEPIVSKIDTSSPLVQQTEVLPVAPKEELNQAQKLEPDTKTVKTLRVIAPPVAPEKQDAVVQQQQVQTPEPETTATIPPNPPAQQQPQVPQRVHQQRQVQQQPVRRETPKSQADNPLFQLFGIRQYK